MKFKKTALIAVIAGTLVAVYAIYQPTQADNQTAVQIEGRMDMAENSEKVNQLNDVQKHVTQNDGTEPPFQNEYWDNKEPGI